MVIAHYLNGNLKQLVSLLWSTVIKKAQLKVENRNIFQVSSKNSFNNVKEPEETRDCIWLY